MLYFLLLLIGEEKQILILDDMSKKYHVRSNSFIYLKFVCLHIMKEMQ